MIAYFGNGFWHGRFEKDAKGMLRYVAIETNMLS